SRLKRLGFAKQVSLNAAATEGLQGVESKPILHPLCNDIEAHPSAKLDQRLDDLTRLGIFLDSRNERSIDLHLVEWQPQQCLEVSRSGPEIIDGRPNSACSKFAEYCARTIEIGNARCLGHFNGQACWLKARSGQCLLEDVQDAVISQHRRG